MNTLEGYEWEDWEATKRFKKKYGNRPLTPAEWEAEEKLMHGKRKCAGGLWTVNKFWGFLRSALRRASVNWPPRRQVLLEARRESQSSNKRLKWEYLCCTCNEWHPGKEVQVDHVEEVGALHEHAHLPGFVLRLFCEAEGLRVQCKVCHGIKTKGDK